jgi:hypothetical protein
MRQKEKLAEFAKSKGKEVLNDVVPFDDEAAARAFDREAYEAGIRTCVSMGQSKWVYGNTDTSDAPKDWSVIPL